MKLCHFSLKKHTKTNIQQIKKIYILDSNVYWFSDEKPIQKKNQNVCYYIMHNTKELQSAVSFLILVFFFYHAKNSDL